MKDGTIKEVKRHNDTLSSEGFIKIIRAEEEYRGFWEQYWSDGKLTFKDVFITGIIRLDCDFEYPYNIDLENCKFNTFHISQGIFKGFFYIRDSNFEDLVISSMVIFESELLISKCKLNTLLLDGTFHYRINIVNSDVKSNFHIKGGLFYDLVYFGYNVYHNATKISGCDFKSYIMFDNVLFEKYLSFENVTFEKEIQVSVRSDFKPDIIFNSGTYKDNIKLIGSFKNIVFLGGVFEQLMFNTEVSIERFNVSFVDNLVIKYLNLNFSKIDCKYYLFEGKAGKIYKLELEGLFLKEYLCEFVSMSTPDNLTINNFTNFGNIYFKDVKPYGLIFDDHGFFTIKNSDLGKTTFMSSDFSTMYLDFQSSKITECFISDTSMPYEIKTFEKGDGFIKIKANPEQERIGYGQLKKIYENRGDSVTALEYYAKEINALLISSKIPVAEKINLCLARISTNHGTDWARGLFSTIICAGICFFFLCLHLNIEPSFTEEGWNFFWNNSLSAFIEFLNPLHKTKDIISILKNIKSDEVKLTWTVSLVGFLSKIFITYFEYQLIQAFRKYGKK